jgi:hypothetical protein
MNEGLFASYQTIGAFCAMIGAFIALATFWGRFSGRVTLAQSSASSASIEVLANKLRIDQIQRDLSDYREKAAREFVTDAELINAERRIMAAVAEIKTDISGVNARLDRVLDTREHTPHHA